MASDLRAAAALANTLWVSSAGPACAAYARALRHPRQTQASLLARYLRENAATAYGTSHQFSRIRSVEEFQARVPLTTYDDYAPWVDRICNGETGVLTSSPVTRLSVSSGSTAAAKLLPSTPRLQREFARAVAPWVFDLYRGAPDLLAGRAYWSITPQGGARQIRASRVPIGFDEDAAYLGGWSRWLVTAAQTTPPAVLAVADVDAFRFITLLFMLRARDLRLISVWHPSYLSLLLRARDSIWTSLVRDIHDGTVAPSLRLPEDVRAALTCTVTPDRNRASELERLGPDRPAALWPHLHCISCWGDAHAAMHLDEVRQLFPEAAVQAKGLIATEAIVSVPFSGRRPLALRSHFFEFLDEDAQPKLAHQLEAGRAYSVVVTTGGGLYRYRLADRVEVDGFVGKTPSIRFLGRENHVSDLVGEKLSEGFVSDGLQKVFGELGMSPRFAMLVPERGVTAAGYVLIIELDGPMRSELAAALERQLRTNPHYEYAVRLGQLESSRVFRVVGAYDSYTGACRRAGLRLGDVKPSALCTRVDWADHFAAADMSTSP